MFSISALGKNVTLTVDQKKDAPLKIDFPVPKSERNLESSFVFPDGGNKDVDRRTGKKRSGESAGEERTIPPVE
jgi:hypothetical protein